MSNSKSFIRVTSVLGLGAALTLFGGCEQAAEICDLQCPAEGILDGNASISGLASVDSFFSAVVGFGKAAVEVRAGVDAELRGIAVSLDLEPGASAAEVRAKLAGKLAGAVTGGLKVSYAAPR